MADRVISAEARITARDATGNVFGAIANKIRGIERTAAATNSRIGALSASIVSRAAAVVGPAAAGAFLAKSVTEFAATERRMTRIMNTADAAKSKSAGTMQALQALAQETATPIDNVTAGLENLIAQGKSLPEALGLLPAVVRTAQASGAATEDLASTVGALGINFGVTADKAQHAFDILNEAGKSGMFELKDMARYIPSLGAQWSAFGMKGEHGIIRMAASMQFVRKITGTAEEAYAALSDAIGKAETTETFNKFKKFGIDIRKTLKDARKDGKDLLDVYLDTVNKAIGGDLSKLPQLFGDKQGQQGIRALLTQRDALEQFTRSLGNVDGSTLRDLQKVLGDTQASIDRMANSWERAKQSIGKGLAPTVSKALEAIANVADEGGDLPDNIVRQTLPGTGLNYGSSSQTARSAYLIAQQAARSGLTGMARGRAAERSVPVQGDSGQSWGDWIAGILQNPRTGARSPQRWGAWWGGGKTPGQMIEEEQKAQAELNRYRGAWRTFREKDPRGSDDDAWKYFNDRLGRGGLPAYRTLRENEADRAHVPRPSEDDIQKGFRESITGAVSVDTQVTVKIDSADIRAIVTEQVSRITSTSPLLNAGPGSVGRTSPDAAPGNPGPAPGAPAGSR